nr:hypothetical protein [Aurantimonas manganoxydans]
MNRHYADVAAFSSHIMNDVCRRLVSTTDVVGAQQGARRALMLCLFPFCTPLIRATASPKSACYSPLVADGAYIECRRRDAVLESDGRLRQFFIERLSEGCSPEQVAG